MLRVSQIGAFSVLDGRVRRLWLCNGDKVPGSLRKIKLSPELFIPLKESIDKPAEGDKSNKESKLYEPSDLRKTLDRLYLVPDLQRQEKE